MQLFSFKKEILLNGVGFKCFYNLKKHFLLLQIGKSHYVKLNNYYYKDIVIKTKKNKLLLLSKSSAKLGNFCANIKLLKKPDPYKNIGVLVKNDKNLRKLKVGKRR